MPISNAQTTTFGQRFGAPGNLKTSTQQGEEQKERAEFWPKFSQAELRLRHRRREVSVHLAPEEGLQRRP